MNIDQFVSFANSNAKKIPLYGIEDYKNINADYYNKLSVEESEITRCPKNRLSYEVIWDEKNNDRVVFVLFNPSSANSNTLDETLKNCVRICYALNQNSKDIKNTCGGMIIYNTFTIRHPQIEEALSNIDIEYKKNNNPIFRLSENYPNNISYLIAAWGNNAKKKLRKDYFDCLKEQLSKLYKKQHKIYAYNLNKSGEKQPSHPSPRCVKYIKKFIEEPIL